MKEKIFIIAGSYHQFNDYCKHKNFKPVKSDIFENEEGIELHYASQINKLYGQDIKKIIFVGIYWENECLKNKTPEELCFFKRTIIEYDDW
jgi:hypothetical protein